MSKKRNSSSDIQPVERLKEHIVSLDAAMLVAATAAEVGAVHKLRTTTRRVEAHLRLVDLLGQETRPEAIPKHAKEARAVRRRLRTVRRAAGTVRDLDVQVEAIWYDAPAKTGTEDGALTIVRREAKALRKHLSHNRELEAAKLIAVLHAQQQKLAAALQELEEAMKPAAGPAIDAAQMGTRIQQWFSGQAGKLAPSGGKAEQGESGLQTHLSELDEDALHALRKSAKLYRYMAESAPEGSPVNGMAAHFEAVQEAGGKWHDWLLLARLSKGFHGKKAALTLRYTEQSERALAEYLRTLQDLLPLLTETPVV